MTGYAIDCGRASAAGRRWSATLKLGLFAGTSAIAIASLALANPQGGEVVSGQATIATPSATQTTVTQASDKAIIDWKSFNIGANESTVFVQPNSNSVALNRIFDNDPSVIAGLLSANGKLILINRNGLMFDSGAVINAAGLVATTSDIGNDDFIAGRLNFSTPGNANAQISNKGLITADEGGVIAFVAPSVRNSGVITAKLGRVALGSGDTFTLDLYGDNLISFPVSAEIARQLVDADGNPLTSLIDVSGKIDAGSVQLSARAARGIIDTVINVDGEIIASGIKQAGGTTSLTGTGNGLPGYGGAISIDGGANGVVNVSGTLDASGGQGGLIGISGENVVASGAISANGSSGAGGSVAIAANNFASLTGSISANGFTGGSVDVNSANNLLTAGAISASGAGGAGGTISLTATNRQIATSATLVSVNGASGGGSIFITGGEGLFTSGSYAATSPVGQGGTVSVGGRDIKMIDSSVDASGASGGGTIAVGFTGAGDGRAINADKILISPTSTFNADATGNGNGGSVVFWSNLATDFLGTITARGGLLGGNGGFLEVSSKNEVGFWGLGDASAASGLAGSLSLDPKNLIVATTGSTMPSYELIDPGTGSTSFGANVATLSNGNTVVTSSNDDTVQSNSGAVFVFNTTTGALVSMITGSRADDTIGVGGITVLSSGNFVFASANWDNGAPASNAGAVTFVNGTTGLSGTVSSSNSLVGSASNMSVGSGGVTALSNGNYAVASPNWDSGNSNVGAVTWGNGATGTVGSVSAANSLVGSATDDQVGSGGVVALTNGNYVVRSMLWNNVGAADAGAVTWGNGLGGTAGAVSAANSLVGSAASDQVGSSGVRALTNGNYVVASSLWNNAGATDAGAVTWGNGFGGTVGAISAANSMVGNVNGNEVGNGGVVALSNGNYVAISSNWDNAGATNAGAVTWGNGATGTFLTVGSGNSLVGTQANDNVGGGTGGGVVALNSGASGNYVVVSTNWDNAGTQNAGAVTWRSGTAGSGTNVSAANSLVGSSANDNVGSAGVKALTNGNYVVASPNYDGGFTDRGAATWGNGTTGTSGTVAAAVSLLGNASNNQVGSGGVVALTNGNYVVLSPSWDNGGSGNQGASTWGNGATGTGGNVGVANSLIGANSNDSVGSGGAVALSNGNYVVMSPNWDNGGDTNTGAVTWRDGTGAFNATVQASNSLIGSNDDDNVGSGGVAALSNGNYVVSSPSMDFSCGFFCTDTNAGAVTLGFGTGGTVGELSATNSIIGGNDNTNMRFAGQGANGEVLARSLTEGTVLVGLTDPNQLSFTRARAQSLTVNPAFVTRTLNTGTAVSLQASNDLTISNDIIVSNPLGNGGALTLQAGRSVLINADITTDNGNLTIIANELLAAGVIDAQRDPGPAVITMGVGADINAGIAAVRLTILSGAGKTQSASGDLTLRNVTGGTILAENLGTTAGSDVIIASGVLSASGASTPLVLASQGGNFINNAGAGALSTPGGRWLVYSQNPGANTNGGLAGTSYYNTVYNPANPTGVSATGNKFAYSLAANLTVTPNAASREYGAANPAFTYAITGLLPSDTLAAAVQGTPTVSSLANASSSVAGGPYAITASLGTLASQYNYSFSFAPGQLSITPALLTYLADPKLREYGDANGVLTGAIAGLKNGELAGAVTSGTLIFTGAADEFSDVGIYAISGSGLTVTSGNYAAAIGQDPSNATALSVTPAQLFYLAEARIETYGDTDSGVSGDVFGLKNGDDLSDVATGEAVFTTVVTTNTSVGQYAITGSGVTVTNGNYAAVVLQDPSNAMAYTVTQAQLFYGADNTDREYGDPNEVLSGSIDGIVDGDTLESVVSGTLVFTTSATQSSNVGFYDITGSGLTVINSNYAVTVLQDPGNPEALEITPAPLTYISDPGIREYGDANPLFTGIVDGLKNGDLLTSVASGTLTFLSSATATSNVGDYEINGGGLTVISGNYAATIGQDSGNDNQLSVVPARLYFASSPMTSIYGDDIGPANGTIEGLKNGETLESVVIGSLVWTVNAISGDDVGVYEIFGSGIAAFNPNYEVEVLQRPGNEFAMVINPAQLSYLADPKTRSAGIADPPFTGVLAGLKNNDNQDDATIGTLVFTTTAPGDSLGGIYAINGEGLTVFNGNYLATILQDPSNATAFTIIPIPSTSPQAQQETLEGEDGAVEEADVTTASRSNELNIVGTNIVSDDMGDGQNDELAGQLCILGAPEMDASADCNARKAMGN